MGGWSSYGRDSTATSDSKAERSLLLTAAESASSTRWLRGINAGLAAHMVTDRRSSVASPSRARRWRHLLAHSSKALGSENRLRTARSPSVDDTAASERRRKVNVKSALLRAIRSRRSWA